MATATVRACDGTASVSSSATMLATGGARQAMSAFSASQLAGTIVALALESCSAASSAEKRQRYAERSRTSLELRHPKPLVLAHVAAVEVSATEREQRAARGGPNGRLDAREHRLVVVRKVAPSRGELLCVERDGDGSAMEVEPVGVRRFLDGPSSRRRTHHRRSARIESARGRSASIERVVGVGDDLGGALFASTMAACLAWTSTSASTTTLPNRHW